MLKLCFSGVCDLLKAIKSAAWQNLGESNGRLSSSAVIRQMSSKAREFKSSRKLSQKLFKNCRKWIFRSVYNSLTKQSTRFQAFRMKFLAALFVAVVIATCVSLTSQSPVPQNLPLNSTIISAPTQMLSSSLSQLVAYAAAAPVVAVNAVANVPNLFMGAMSNVKPMFSF